MKFSLKFAALSAFAAISLAAPVEKRATNDDIIVACFANLLLTGTWPGTCQAAVSVDIGLIQSLTLKQLTIDFTTSNPWGPTIASSSLTANLLPLVGLLPIYSVQQHVLIADNGIQVGSYNSPWASASTGISTLQTTIPTSTLSVFQSSQTAFVNFIASVASKTSYPLVLKGAVDIKLDLGWLLGSATISGIGFDASIPLPGLNGLKGIKFASFLNAAMGDTGLFEIYNIVNIPNPSYLTLKLGDVSFSTTTSEGFVGYSVVKGLTLVPGDNYVISATGIDFGNSAAVDLYVAVAGGSTVPIYLGANNQTSANSALNSGLIKSGLNSTLVLPGLPTTPSQSPFINWSVSIPNNANSTRQAQATATFQSPYFGIPVQVTQAQSDAGAPGVLVVNGITGADGFNLFSFINTLTYTVGGTSTVKKTFGVQLPQFTSAQSPQLNAIVNFAKTNGYIPLQVSMSPLVTAGGVTFTPFWDSTLMNLGTFNVKTGNDISGLLGTIIG